MRRISRLVALFLILITIPCVAAAQTNGDLISAYRRGDYAVAFPLALKEAQAGNTTAAAILGTLYLTGHGTTKDLGEAKRWLTNAAEAGQPDAEYNLGLIYLEGMGTPKDEKVGAGWILRSAQKGQVFAQRTIGEMFYAGTGVEKNDLEAWYWLLTAAKKNSVGAAFDLGVLYDRQITLRYDDPKLGEFFREIGASDGLASVLATKGGSDRFNLKSVPAQAMRWYRVAAEKDFPRAQLNLGTLYLRGKGTPPDDAAALKWFGLAAAQAGRQAAVDKGALLALMNLGMMYRYGWGAERDEAKAAAYYRQAEARGVLDEPIFKQFAPLLHTNFTDPNCGNFCIGTFVIGPGDFILYERR